VRLVTFEAGAGERVGAFVDVAGEQQVLDLSVAAPGLPADMIGLLAAGPAALGRVRAALERPEPAALRRRADVVLKAPVPRPGKILCIGYNYRGHGAAGAVADPEFPDVFAKTANTVIGPDASVLLPRASHEVDYEAELAVVIGTAGREIAPEHALEHVAGYADFNDVSARDWQRHGSQWVLGKSFDTFGPFGPALVTADEVPDPQDLDLHLSVNGRTTVASHTGEMIFTVSFLVSYLSEVVTLEPGDVIATGTPQKLPDALTEGRFLQDGDVVEITIGHLGTLTSTMRAAP
jgi:2-keto-4-pentenoate hydratase/2-oxohepta-3-ene-1,7-dioic acid hydratase in catechol pathway